MIYVTAATSGPSLMLLKGCPSSSRRWSMRCPCFRQRCGVKLAVGSDERCGRLLACCRHECARPADFLIGLSWLAWPLRLRCSSHSLCAVTALRAARNESPIARFAGMRAQKARFWQSRFEKNPPPTTSAAKNLCVHSPIPHEAGKTGGCFFAATSGVACARLIFSPGGLTQCFFAPQPSAPTKRGHRALS